MRERQHFVALDEYEHGILIDSLNEKRKDLMSEGKTTDDVDELIVTVGHDTQKKFKVFERDKDKRREAR